MALPGMPTVLPNAVVIDGLSERKVSVVVVAGTGAVVSATAIT